jgi:hypothetical protein
MTQFCADASENVDYYWPLQTGGDPLGFWRKLTARRRASLEKSQRMSTNGPSYGLTPLILHETSTGLLTEFARGGIQVKVDAAQDSPIGIRFDESGVRACAGGQRLAPQVSSWPDGRLGDFERRGW